ncbi:MAG TPA: hypothetical protein VE397_18370 [Stellaceae bacterium]|jgi:hypothetical protein|nr:hypothetical protein [Stellaceae bacterium]
MSAIAIVEHKLPTRVRVRIPSKRGDRAFFEAVVAKLESHPNVHHVSASAYTGSVIIHHTGSIDDILALAIDLFELGDRDKLEELAAVAQRSGLRLPEILDATAAVTAALGAYQLVRRGGLGTASENFWAAFGSYRMLNSPRLAAAFAGLGTIQLLRGELLGSATSLLYYSLLAHHMADLERQQIGQDSQAQPGR